MFPPVVLALLAPAERCNQRCPACILEGAGEPVTRFALPPSAYALFLRQFADAKIVVRSVSFQGFEVTLPGSWPYVEATFSTAQRLAIPRSFVTNGMLLHRWTDRIVALEPQRISVSLDGADAETHDPLRGLPGAFEATVASVRRFQAGAPSLTPILAVLSTLVVGRNHRSLLRMPSLLRELGIPRWGVGWQLDYRSGRLDSHAPMVEVTVALAELKDAADEAGIDFHVSDDFGAFDGMDRGRLRARRPFNLDFVYRFDPLGHVRSGREMQGPWSADAPRWDPTGVDAPTAARYWERATRWQRKPPPSSPT